MFEGRGVVAIDTYDRHGIFAGWHDRVERTS